MTCEVPSLSSILAAAEAAAAARPPAHLHPRHPLPLAHCLALRCCGGTPGNPHCPGPSRYPPSSPRGQSQIQPNLPQIYERHRCQSLKPSFFSHPILPPALRNTKRRRSKRKHYEIQIRNSLKTRYLIPISPRLVVDTIRPPWTAPTSTSVAFHPVFTKPASNRSLPQQPAVTDDHDERTAGHGPSELSRLEVRPSLPPRHSSALLVKCQDSAHLFSLPRLGGYPWHGKVLTMDLPSCVLQILTRVKYVFFS